MNLSTCYMLQPRAATELDLHLQATSCAEGFRQAGSLMSALWRGYSAAAPGLQIDSSPDLFGACEQFLAAAYEAFFSQRQAPGAILPVDIQLTRLAAKAVSKCMTRVHECRWWSLADGLAADTFQTVIKHVLAAIKECVLPLLLKGLEIAGQSDQPERGQLERQAPCYLQLLRIGALHDALSKHRG